MCNVNMYYAQRWHRLYSQASEQSSNTNIINQLLIVYSTCNVNYHSFRKTIQECVNASQRLILDNAFIRKVAYTVVIIVTVCA